MQVSCKKNDGVLTVALSGELDHHAARETVRQIAQAIDTRLPRVCQLDMSRVGFMDSSGIAVVLDAHRRMRELGGELIVSHVPAQAGRVFAAAQLQRVVKIAQ